MISLPQRASVKGICASSNNSLQSLTADVCPPITFKRPSRSMVEFASQNSPFKAANNSQIFQMTEDDVIKSLNNIRLSELPSTAQNILNPDIGTCTYFGPILYFQNSQLI